MVNPPRRLYISRIWGFFFTITWNFWDNHLFKVSISFSLSLVLLFLGSKQTKILEDLFLFFFSVLHTHRCVCPTYTYTSNIYINSCAQKLLQWPKRKYVEAVRSKPLDQVEKHSVTMASATGVVAAEVLRQYWSERHTPRHQTLPG